VPTADSHFDHGADPVPWHIAVGRPVLSLSNAASAVREGRRFVEREVRARGAEALVDDAATIVAELLANAVQHGRPPVSVVVGGDASCIRISVHDANPRPPVRPAASTTNMTGRGLSLVGALAARWGVDREAQHGRKVVWADLTGTPGRELAEVDVDVLLAEWSVDQPEGTVEPRFDVVLGDVPTDLLIAAKAHIDNVVREFTLAASGSGSGAVPEELSRLIEVVVYDFAEARDAIKRQALAAARDGHARTRLALQLPSSAADAGERYLAGLEDADSYARAARLLTVESPAPHRLFRRWYVENVIAQLRAAAAGRTPEPVKPFDAVLLDEVQRLAALQRTTSRMARLQQVTAALTRSRTPEDVAGVVVSEGVDALGATGGSLLLPAEDGVHLSVPGAVGYGAELVDALREERLDAPLPAATTLRTGEPVWLESQDERDARFPMLQGFEATTVAMCAVPLIVGGRTLGALRFSFDSHRLFDEEERAFVLALAAQTAQTLARAEVYAAERQASLQLQRALLPGDVPVVPGFEVATHYTPAGGEEAGGDFFDVLCLRDGRCLAVIGDVMGRGVDAAAGMAQVRTMIRAYAVVDPAPEVVLAKVDAYFAAFDLAQLVTVTYCLIEPDSGTMQLINAGHLPPILVDRTGGRLLDVPAGLPLGVMEAPRQVTSVHLAPGASLVAVTDGLVERRGADIDAGLQRVVAAVGAAASGSATEILHHALVAGVGGAVHDDDVTVLVLHRLGETA
jgi:serine phosphatase RsbU (regulator of sigma subunit)/anti-sigma regulatory factor (Ser/Thr protein kinase)